MKLIKYFTGFLLFLLMFIFIGEMYVWHLDSFETEYKCTTFFLQKNTKKTEMLNDICEAAREANVGVFVVGREINSLFSCNINVYITDKDVQDDLENISEIKQGKFQSILLGTVNIKFKDWQQIPDISKFENYYIIGNDLDAVEFKKMLVNKYAGRFPQDGYTAVNSRANIIVGWVCILFFLILLTLYEILQRKKEVFLKITIGERVDRLVLKNILSDIVVYFGMFFSLIFVLRGYTNLGYLKRITWILFICFVVCNSMIYFVWLFTDYRKDMHMQNHARGILKISYFYKFLTSIMLIAIMSGSVELISEGINCFRQKDFFETRKDYHYITAGGGIECAQELLSIYYSRAKQTGKELSLVDLGKWQTNAEYICADKGAKDYICTQIPEIGNKLFADKVYYLVPKGYYSEEYFEDMRNIFYAYFETECEYEIIEYKKTAWIMAVSNTGSVKSVLRKNPIIILNNTDSVQIPVSSILYMVNATMFAFTEEEFEEIALQNAYHNLHYRTNAYENYMYFWTVAKRSMVMGIVFLLILLTLEGLILKNILKYEYQVNAKRLLLDKIHGVTFYYRHKRAILVLISGWISLFVSTVICVVLDFSSTIYIVTSGIMVLLIEFTFIVAYSYKLDKVNINKIFKGGAL